MRKNWKKIVPGTLEEAVQLTVEFGEANRKPAKVMADLLETSLPTYYRWLSENSFPLNKLRSLEMHAGCHYISDFLSLSAGRLVVPIPTGKKATVEDIALLQEKMAAATKLLAGFYRNGDGLDETLAAMTELLTDVGWHRENVAKSATPELDLF